jgi:hypothetical protein
MSMAVGRNVRRGWRFWKKNGVIIYVMEWYKRTLAPEKIYFPIIEIPSFYFLQGFSSLANA